MALQQGEPVLVGEHRRDEREGQPSGRANLGGIPVQDQEQPEGLERDKQERLGEREGEAEARDRLRRGRIAGDRVGECGRYPQVPELRDHEGPNDQSGQISASIGTQHPGQKGSGDHEDQLDRDARRDRQDGVPSEPLT